MEHIHIEEKTYYIITNKTGVPQKCPLGVINFNKETGWAFKQGEGARAITHSEMQDIVKYLDILNFDRPKYDERNSDD